MDKKYRKEIEHQLAMSIAYILKKSDEKAAAGMSKAIKSAAKSVAKKFVKHKLSLEVKPAERKVETTEKKIVVKKVKVAAKKAKTAAKKAVKKSAPVKKVSGKKSK